MGVWGDIPIDGTTQHVDASYSAGDSDGTAAKPWPSIQAGVDAALENGVVAIAAGSYVENVSIAAHAVALWGVCPDNVTITGTIAIAAGDTELRNVAITGSGDAITIDGVNALVEGVRLHDTAGWGIRTVGGSVTVRGALVEGVYERGIYIEGAQATVEDSVVRDMVAAPLSPGLGGGRGINVRDHVTTGARSSVAVRHSVVERSRENGVLIHASDATIESTLVRDTLPSLEDRFGRCVSVQSQPLSREPAQAVIRASVVERCHDGGLVLNGTVAQIESTTVRDVEPNVDMGDRGYGIAATVATQSGLASDVSVQSSLVLRGSEAGILVSSSKLDLDGVAIRDTRPTPVSGGRAISAQSETEAPGILEVSARQTLISGGSEVAVYVLGGRLTLEGVAIRDVPTRPDGFFGRGISVDERMETAERATAVVRWSVVENTSDTGFFCSACDAVVESTLIRDVLPAQPVGVGVGVVAQPSSTTLAPSTLALRWSIVERLRGFGVTVSSLEAIIEGTVIRDVETATDESFGDGIGAAFLTGPVSTKLSHVRIERAARAGLSLWGGSMTLEATVLDCNTIHMAGDPFKGETSTFVDSGHNACGCDGSPVLCKAISARLEPPQSFDSLE
jgi:hypothetical protein